MEKTVERSKDFWEARENLIGVLSARKIMAVKRAARAALSINTEIAEDGTPSTDMAVLNLNEKADDNSSANAAVSRFFAKVGDENDFEKAVAYFSLLNETCETRDRQDLKELMECVRRRERR